MKNPFSDGKRAVALAYQGAQDGAPRIIAKGGGVSAEAIISLARESGVYVHQSPELVNLLMQVDLDQEIPPELFQAVAEIIFWLHKLDQGASESQGSSRR